VEARFPQFSKSIKIGEKEIDYLDSIAIVTDVKGKIVHKTYSYLLSAYDSGLYAIPPLKVLFFNTQTQQLDSLATDTLFFAVATLEVDTSKGIAPIKEPMDMPFIFEEIKLQLIITAIVSLLLGLFIWYLWSRNKRQKNIVEPEKPKVPAHIIALEQLQKLEAQQFWQKGEVKTYHSELSDIIREYLENRYKIIALEATTDEIMHKMKTLYAPAEQKLALQEMLELADLVKFAKVNPLPDEHQRSFDIVKGFVNATKIEDAL